MLEGSGRSVTAQKTLIPSEKLEAIEAIVPPHLRTGFFRLPNKLITVLCSGRAPASRYFLVRSSLKP
jgi:hypothetical protein